MIPSHSQLPGISLTSTKEMETDSMNPNSTLSLGVDFDKSVLLQAFE